MLNNNTSIPALLAALLILGTAIVGAQGQQAPPQPQPAPATQPQPAMMDKCKAMMAEREKMMAELTAADQRLDGLVAKMNAASGQEKTDATAAVVTEMVAQRKSMRERMMNMQQRMMAHMGEHMQAGKESMATCPIMKGMMNDMGGMKH